MALSKSAAGDAGLGSGSKITWLHNVNEHPPIPVELSPYSSKNHHLITDLSMYYRRLPENKLGEVIQGTKFSNGDGTIVPSPNGFLHSVVQAYTKHHNLVFRPDDIWLAIMIQFSFYVNGNAEELRSKFVAHKGKKNLSVDCDGPIRSFPYEKLVDKMGELIHENLTDPEVRDWVTPNFSTTTPEDKMIAGIVFMATMKKYFSYLMGGCGIPNIGLDGTLEDWKEIRNRLEKFNEFEGLHKWKELLAIILDNLILTKVGVNSKELKDFWNTICHYKVGGSGTEDIFTGWIATFGFFNKLGKPAQKGPGKWPRIGTEKDIVTGVVEVDVSLIDPSGTYPSTFFAGFMALEKFGAKKDGIKPRSGWAIALNSPASPASPKSTNGIGKESEEAEAPARTRRDPAVKLPSAAATNGTGGLKRPKPKGEKDKDGEEDRKRPKPKVEDKEEQEEQKRSKGKVKGEKTKEGEENQKQLKPKAEEAKEDEDKKQPKAKVGKTKSKDEKPEAKASKVKEGTEEPKRPKAKADKAKAKEEPKVAASKAESEKPKEDPEPDEPKRRKPKVGKDKQEEEPARQLRSRK